MDDNDDKQRVAARCDRCEKINIVQIRSDGSLQPIGQSNFCECNSPRLQVLDIDLE